METIGEKIRAIRLRKGFSQVELAKGIVTASMISQIESDRAKPSHNVLTQIVERLEVPLEDLMGNTMLNFKTASQFNMAKAMVIRGEYTSALRLLEDLVQRNQYKVEPFLIAYYHAYCQIQLHLLEEASSKLEYLAEQVDQQINKYNFAKVQHLYGMREMKKSGYLLAEHHYQTCLHALQQSKVPDEWLKSSALLELGKAQQEVGKWSASLETFHQAIAALELNYDLESLAQLYLDMAQSYLMANQLEESAEYAQRAVLCTEVVSSTYNRLFMEMKIATVTASIGDRESAEQTLKRVADEFIKLQKTEAAGIAYAELAKLQVERGQVDLAEETAQTAKQWLPPNHSHAALALRVQAKACQTREQTERATKLFKQAADCFKLIGCYREYEITMKELSDHLTAQNDVHMAYKVISDMLTYNLQVREARGIVL